MKKLLSLLALGSASLSAEQYNQTYDYPSSGYSYYSGQENQAQFNRPYYQDDRVQWQQQPWSQQANNQWNTPSNVQNRYYSNQPDTQYIQKSPINSVEQEKEFNNTRSKDVPTDQELVEKIRDSLRSGWFSKGYENVNFDVHFGNVTLSGTVDTLENKNKVDDAVKKINGVRQIVNQIRIARENADKYSDEDLQKSEKTFPQDSAYSPEDRQINAKIRDKLGRGWFSRGYEALVIKTANGIVVISGPIDKIEDAQKISEELKDVEGVKGINSKLTIKNK